MAGGKKIQFARRRIGVIGGNSPILPHMRLAEKMGQLIAENDYILVNGGMKGVMEASAKGAMASGGLVIGILPGKSPLEANEYIDIAIPTGLGYMRNAMVVLNSDILVAIDGEYGTLSEIAYAQIFNKTVLGIDTWEIKGVIPAASPEAAIRWIKDYFDHKL